MFSIVQFSGSQPITIDDGTNAVSIKAASTAAVGADKALVVAISPNNSIAVTGTFFQATQPVSIAGTIAVSGPLTDTQLRATAVPVSGTFFQATQPVSGTVTANLGTIAGIATETTLATMLTLAGFQARINTLGQKTMANSTPVVLSSDQSSIPVTGTFFQATQPVSGTFFQATQPVSIAATVAVTQSGTWNVGLSTGANTIGIVNQGTAASLANAWSIKLTDGTNTMPTMDVAARAGFHKLTDGTNTAAIKAASTPPIATDTALVVSLSPNSAQDATASGNLGALNGAVTVVQAGNAGVGFQLTAGTLIGTLIPEISVDGGTTYVASYFVDPSTGARIGTLVFASSNTAATKSIYTVAGTSHVRVRVSAYTSGTAAAAIRSTIDGDITQLFEGVAGSGLPPTVAQVGGTDGTNLRAVSVDSTGKVQIAAISSALPAGANTIGIVNQGTAAALASAWPIKLTDGTNTMPTGDVVARSVFHQISDGTTGPVAVKAASTAPVATDKALVVVLSPNQPPIPVTSSPANVDNGIAFGDPSLASATLSPVRRTTYTEQTVNFTGSIVSSSALDAAAGTGARTVRIYYVDATGVTAGTEDVTLNGTTPVNLVTTTKCFIEKMEVLTAGSTGVAGGIISLKTGAAGAGTTVGTIALGDTITFWAHHYVVSGKTCNVTGTLIGSDSTVAGNGSVFVLKSKAIGASVERQIGDFLTLYGQSSQTARNYGSYIQVAGPTRIVMYVKPVSGTSNVFRGSFDFYDQ